jgi:hypothetical protein
MIKDYFNFELHVFLFLFEMTSHQLVVFSQQEIKYVHTNHSYQHPLVLHFPNVK